MASSPSAPASSASRANWTASAVPYPAPATTGTAAGGLLHRGGHDEPELLGGQGVELTRAAGREHRRRTGVDAPADVRPEGVHVDGVEAAS